MDRRFVTVVFVLVCVSIRSTAEVTRLPFFTPQATFTEVPGAFPSFSSWMLLDHGLNQNDTPDTAHRFDTGTVFTLYANRGFSVSALARELFQFEPSPDGPFNFWARSLVTDLRLAALAKLPPFIASVGYRHDCKHDISDTRREVIHDAVFLQALFPPRRLPAFPSALNSRIGFSLEAEVNTPLIFQVGEEESDRSRFTAECELVPYATFGGRFLTFLDARVSLLNRESGDRVAVQEPWNVDWLFRAGAELRSGMGGLRLAYGLERVTDNWATLDPMAETISAVTLLLVFGSASRLES
jgi:hypothetical protein